MPIAKAPNQSAHPPSKKGLHYSQRKPEYCRIYWCKWKPWSDLLTDQFIHCSCVLGLFCITWLEKEGKSFSVIFPNFSHCPDITYSWSGRTGEQLAIHTSLGFKNPAGYNFISRHMELLCTDQIICISLISCSWYNSSIPLSANSARQIAIFLISPEIRPWHFMQIVSLGENRLWHFMQTVSICMIFKKPIFWKKKKKIPENGLWHFMQIDFFFFPSRKLALTFYAYCLLRSLFSGKKKKKKKIFQNAVCWVLIQSRQC